MGPRGRAGALGVVGRPGLVLLSRGGPNTLQLGLTPARESSNTHSVGEGNRQMARITVQAVHVDGEPRRWTLSERIVAEHLDGEHYVTQLIERLRCATADAESLERQSADLPRITRSDAS